MSIVVEEQFSLVSDSPYNRRHHAVAVYQNLIYVYGGQCNASARTLSDLWSYRADTQIWSRLVINSPSNGSRNGTPPGGSASPGMLIGSRFVSGREGLFLFGGRIFDDPDSCSFWFVDPNPSNFSDRTNPSRCARSGENGKCPPPIPPRLSGNWEEIGSQKSEPENVSISSVKCLGDYPSNRQFTSLFYDFREDIIYCFGGFKNLIGATDELWSYQRSKCRWHRHKSGPSARYDAAITIYQSTLIILGGLATTGSATNDCWGYHIELGQWLQWTKSLPKTISGAGLLIDDVIYCVGENGIDAFDLVDRKFQAFYSKLPNLIGGWTVSIGRRNERRRAQSAPHLNNNWFLDSSPKLNGRGIGNRGIGGLGRGSHQQNYRNRILPSNGVENGAFNDSGDSMGVSLIELRENSFDSNGDAGRDGQTDSIPRLDNLSVSYNAKNESMMVNGQLRRRNVSDNNYQISKLFNSSTTATPTSPMVHSAAAISSNPTSPTMHPKKSSITHLDAPVDFLRNNVKSKSWQTSRHRQMPNSNPNNHAEKNSHDVSSFDSRTPVEAYGADPFFNSPCLIVVGGKNTSEPDFVRKPIRTWKLDL